jgi:flagellar protein FliL
MTMTDTPDVDTDVAPAPDAAGKKGKKGKAKKEKGGKSNLVPAIVLALGIAAGGYFMGGSGESAAAPTETTVPEIVEGPLLAIEPMTVNLAGGRYLRVGVSFQMTDAYEDAVEGEEGEAFPHHDASRIQDLLIATLGGRPVDGLATSDGRSAVKEEIHHQVDELFEGEVMEIYFTEFVIQ